MPEEERPLLQQEPPAQVYTLALQSLSALQGAPVEPGEGGLKQAAAGVPGVASAFEPVQEDT
jgi:hypothetical protein